MSRRAQQWCHERPQRDPHFTQCSELTRQPRQIQREQPCEDVVVAEVNRPTISRAQRLWQDTYAMRSVTDCSSDGVNFTLL